MDSESVRKTIEGQTKFIKKRWDSFGERNAGFSMYFETSALNHFEKNRSRLDGLATRNLQIQRRRKWVISPVVIWEILSTADSYRREHLIQIGQCTLWPKLLCTPEAIFTNYIQRGCPLRERRSLQWDKSNWGRIWEDICGNPDKTYIVENDSFQKKVRLLKDVFYQFGNVLLKKKSKIEINGIEGDFEPLFSELFAIGKKYKVVGFSESVKNMQLKKIITFLVFMFMCWGISVENEIVEDYWKQKKVGDIILRFEYLCKHTPNLFRRGPFIYMALMALAQFNFRNGFSRGVLFDCLHCIYLYYTDFFVSNDKDFLAYRLAYQSPLTSKILMVNELRWTSAGKSR